MKIHNLHLPVLLVGAVLLAACSQAPVGYEAPAGEPPTRTNQDPLGTPKNIVLMIGDGMGVSQVTAGLVTGGKLALERFPVGGLIKTWADPEFVTDSAAAATALATGHKSYNGAISVDRNGAPLRTLSEEAMSRGLRAGVVSTSSVVHATPASFLAHRASRRDYFDIALDMAGSGADLIMGGGTMFFLPDSEDGGAREDGRNLVSEWEASNGCFFTSLGDTGADLPDCTRRLLLFTEEHMPPRLEGREPALPAMTEYALNFLARDDAAFVLMIEGSQIDWAGHGNKRKYLADEMLDFDEAIATVLAFARADGNTLVIVTADHETGGLAIADGDLARQHFKSDWTTDGHTATMVPLFAFGPGSAAFGGIHDNAELGRMLLELLPESTKK